MEEFRICVNTCSGIAHANKFVNCQRGLYSVQVFARTYTRHSKLPRILYIVVAQLLFRCYTTVVNFRNARAKRSRLRSSIGFKLTGAQDRVLIASLNFYHKLNYNKWSLGKVVIWRLEVRFRFNYGFYVRLVLSKLIVHCLDIRVLCIQRIEFTKGSYKDWWSASEI